jgi:hypothetical protein
VTKAWGMVFSCLSSRACHLEVLSEWTTECFLAAFNRMIARRGCPSFVLSDHALQFKLADKLLRSIYKNVDFSVVAAAGAKKGIQWAFSTPLAAFTNACAERTVGLLKRPLKIALQHSTLTLPQLEVLVLEIEQTINARPLAVAPESFDEMTAITPFELCTGRKAQMLPDARSSKGKLIEASSFVQQLRRRRQLLQSFWKNWRNSYLAGLAPERRWKSADTKFNPFIRLNDIVHIRDDEKVPRSVWKYGRVVELYPSADNVVRKVKLLLPRPAHAADNAAPKFLVRSVRKLALLEAAAAE